MRAKGVVEVVRSQKMVAAIEVCDQIAPALELLEARCLFGCSRLRQMGNVVLRTQ